jgi:30S ribosomal protein S31
MGKGDKKTKKGKISMGSYGVSRKREQVKYNSATAGKEANPPASKGGSSAKKAESDKAAKS